MTNSILRLGEDASILLPTMILFIVYVVNRFSFTWTVGRQDQGDFQAWRRVGLVSVAGSYGQRSERTSGGLSTMFKGT